MKKYLFFFISLLFSCQNNSSRDINISPSNSSKANLVKQNEEKKYSLAERELAYLMTIWPGEYDNVEQLDFDKYAKKEGIENGGHLRMHSLVERVDLSTFGDYTVYVETYKNDQAQDIYQQSIYHLVPMDNGEIQITPYHFKKFQSDFLKRKSDFLEKINPNSSNLKKGCNLKLNREGMAFLGKTIEKDCILNIENDQETIDFQIRISEDGFWFQHQKYDKNSKTILPEQQQLSWYQLE